MKANNHLYQLIKSLDKAEKRYFKMYASQHLKNNSSNYILLFDAIDRQKLYDEGKLKRKFSNHHFAKNISKTKYLLHKLLLKTLRHLNDAKTTDALIGSYMESVGILFSKNLYSQCAALLQKAKALAVEYEMHNELLQIINWQIKLIPYLTATLSEELLQLSEERQQVMSIKQTEESYYHLRCKALILSELPQERRQLEFALFMQHELVSKEAPSCSLCAKMYYQEIFALYFQSSGDFSSALQHWKAIEQLWQSHHGFLSIKEEYFIYTTCELVFAAINAKDQSFNIDWAIRQIQSIPIKNAVQESKLKGYALILEFISHLTFQRWDRCHELIDAVNELLVEAAPSLPKALVVNLQFHLAIFYFMQRQYKQCVYWIDCIEEQSKNNVRQEVRHYCKLLQLVSNYEIGEHSVLEYYIRQTYRFLRKEHQLKPIEKIILNGVKSLLKAKHSKEELGIFSQLRSELGHLRQQEAPTSWITSDALYFWASDKLNRH